MLSSKFVRFQGFEILTDKSEKARSQNQLKPFIATVPLLPPENLERQGGYQCDSGCRAVTAAVVTTRSFFGGVFQEGKRWENRSSPEGEATSVNQRLPLQ